MAVYLYLTGRRLLPLILAVEIVNLTFLILQDLPFETLNLEINLVWDCFRLFRR